MMHSKWKNLFIIFVMLSAFSACTSVAPEAPDEDLAELDAGSGAEEGGDDGEMMDEGDSADMADEGDGEESVAGDTGGDEFTDDEFAEPENETETADAGQEPAEDEGLDAEDPFAEEEAAGGGEVAEQAAPTEEAAPLPEESTGDSAAGGFAESSAGGSGGNEITDIKFMANQAGGTVVIETSSTAKYRTRQNPESNQFVIEIAGANLPKRLKRPYIMKEFQGEFAAINAYQNPGSSTARVVVQMRNPGKALVQQEGNSILVLPPTQENMAAFVDDAQPGEVAEQEEMKAAVEEEDKTPSYDVAKAEHDEKVLGSRTLDEFLTGNNRFYGRNLSIQTKDADVRDALNFIAEYSGVNMIISDDVGGSISLKLRDVPWDQALVTIMRAKRLGYIRQGNVIRISTLGTLQAEADSARAIIQSQKSLIPIRVKVIPVSYAVVEDLARQLTPFLSEGRGKIAGDNRTSSLIVTDTDEVINRVARLVKSLDIPPMQVMIEGKIVEAQEQFQRTIGVNWGFDGETMTLSDTGGANGGPLDLRTTFSVNPVGRDSLRGNPFALNLSVGRLDFLGELSAVLSLAETENVAKVLSSPRIVTLNKQPAEITQESQVLTKSTVVDQTGSSKTQIERTPVALNLKVTPQITAVGSVILDVDVKRQFAGGVVDTASLARAINTRQAKTKVLVDNGQTAVIGGVYQSDNTQSDTGVPVLKDLPVVGWLFKARGRDYQKNELLIFLTPRIISFGGKGESGGMETSSATDLNEGAG